MLRDGCVRQGGQERRAQEEGVGGGKRHAGLANTLTKSSIIYIVFIIYEIYCIAFTKQTNRLCWLGHPRRQAEGCAGHPQDQDGPAGRGIGRTPRLKTL